MATVIWRHSDVSFTLRSLLRFVIRAQAKALGFRTHGLALATQHSMSLMLVLRTLRALRLISWLCIVVLIWLSWIPQEWEARTGLRGEIEHALAYCGTGAIFAFAYQWGARWRIVSALVAVAAVLEVGQIWAPGRTPDVTSFAASALGTIMGVVIGRAAIVWLVTLSMRSAR